MSSLHNIKWCSYTPVCITKYISTKILCIVQILEKTMCTVFSLLVVTYYLFVYLYSNEHGYLVASTVLFKKSF